jgi:hypothetical protein
MYVCMYENIGRASSFVTSVANVLPMCCYCVANVSNS